MKRAVLLVGHGSKLAHSSDSLFQVRDALREKEPDTIVHAAFLEICTPDIPGGIELCLEEGADEIVVVPYFVQAGRHVVEDIPRIVASLQEKHPTKSIRLASYLGFDERLVDVVRERIETARGVKTAHRPGRNKKEAA